MGTVYRAWDTRLEIEVALKVPHAHLIDRPGVLERFYREARAAARLCHPALCQVYDLGEWQGCHYLTMRYVDGRPLRAAPGQDERTCAALVRRLASAMAEAHRLGVIHRDLKRANILLTHEGEPVITDFGLALRLDVDDWQTELGSSVGTVTHMAPEQLGDDRDALGPGCDVYALGVVLYELLTGRVPFVDPNRRVLRERILHEAPAPPSALHPGLDPRLEVVCLRALAKGAVERFADMGAFATALDDYLGAPAPAVARRRPRVRPEAVRFAFTGMGARAPARTAPQDRLFLDVGNDLRPGVLDHHHLTAYSGSTSSLVLAHPAFVDGAVVPGRRPHDPFTIVLHEQPDLDCLISAYLAIAYLDTQSFPAAADALARYADLVDEGSPGFTLARPFTLYAAYQQLANRLARRTWDSDAAGWQERLRQGLSLVAYVVAELGRGRALPDVDAFACPGLFGPEDRAEVARDVERYRRKLADPRTQARTAPLRLPGRFGGTQEVEALLVRDVQNAGDPERCVFFKDWARTDAEHRAGGGFVALSVFHSPGPQQIRRGILSVTPTGGVTLRGLGALLDEAEAARRRQVHGVDDRVTDPVTGEAKPARPGYGNADPWYDGRAHGYTIVDSPRSGTLLTADEIEGIFLRFGDNPAPRPLAG
jgi:serine/threonine protein kinase